MAEHFPIIPPPELIKDWHDEWNESDRIGHSAYTHIAIRAAQWGSDQELEACCELLDNLGGDGEMIRRYRRHKLLSLKQQAQAVWNAYELAYCDLREFDPRKAGLCAALRAAADQVVPKEWPTIEDYNEYEQGVAAAHIKHRNKILTIADQLEVQ